VENSSPQIARFQTANAKFRIGWIGKILTRASKASSKSSSYFSYNN
jgi:hypothetical protein